MIYLIAPALIPPIIQGIGGLAAYFASRAAVRRQNKYNSPAMQAKRLREAGIPLVASKYFENTQKSLEDTQGISQAATGISSYVSTQNQLEAGRIAKYQADLLENERDVKLEVMPDMNGIQIDNYIPVSGDTAQAQSIRRQWALDQANRLYGEHKEQMENIDMMVKAQLKRDGKLTEAFITQIKHQLASIGLIDEQKITAETNNKINRIIIETGENAPGGMTFMRALIARFLLKL